MSAHLQGLNPAQLKAATHPGHTLAVACPGSGKTRVLTCRAAHVLLQSPQNTVCAVTFTRDAAEELAQRISHFVPESERKRVISGTFHALALRQLRAGRIHMKLLSPGEQRSLIARAIDAVHPMLDYEVACKHIEHMKCSLDPTPESKLQLDLYLSYQGMLEHLGAQDFQDLMLRAVQGMQDGIVPPLPVTHLLVDEYQDADVVQHAWVRAHVEAGAIVTVVGDDDQSLYGWRNAMGYQGMRDFQIENGAELVTMDTNYRSRREILELGEQLILRNTERMPKALRTHQGPGGQIYSRRFHTRDEETDAIAEALETEPRNWAIIARTNAILNYAQAKLDTAQIPYTRVGGANFWNSPAPNALLLLLGAIATGQPLGAEHALHYTNCDPEALAQAHRARTLARHRQPPEAIGDSEVDDFASKLYRWHQQVEGGMDDLVVMSAGAWLGSRIKTKSHIAKLDMARSVFSRLRGRLSERVRAIQRKKEPEEREPGASLLTMHASKGLEFEHVWIMGMEAETCPHMDNPSVDEERRLFYVGITRAKTRLFISSASQENHASPFLVELGMAKAPTDQITA